MKLWLLIRQRPLVAAHVNGLALGPASDMPAAAVGSAGELVDLCSVSILVSTSPPLVSPQLHGASNRLALSWLKVGPVSHENNVDAAKWCFVKGELT